MQDSSNSTDSFDSHRNSRSVNKEGSLNQKREEKEKSKRNRFVKIYTYKHRHISSTLKFFTYPLETHHANTNNEIFENYEKHTSSIFTESSSTGDQYMAHSDWLKKEAPQL